MTNTRPNKIHFEDAAEILRAAASPDEGCPSLGDTPAKMAHLSSAIAKAMEKMADKVMPQPKDDEISTREWAMTQNDIRSDVLGIADCLHIFAAALPALGEQGSAPGGST